MCEQSELQGRSPQKSAGNIPNQSHCCLVFRLIANYQKIVKKLREKAHLAMSQLGYTPTDADHHRQDEELKVLGGHTRVVSTRPAGYLATPQSSPPVEIPTSTDVHPSLMEDLVVVRKKDLDARMAREREGVVATSNSNTSGPMTARAGLSKMSSRQSMRREVFVGEVHNAGPSSAYSNASQGGVPAYGQARKMDGSHMHHVHGVGVGLGVGGGEAEDAYAECHAPPGGGDGGPSAVFGHGATPVDGFGNVFMGDAGPEASAAGVGAEANAVDTSTDPMQNSHASWNFTSMMSMSDDYVDVGWQGFVAQLGVSGG